MKMLAWLLALYAPGGWFCPAAIEPVLEDDGLLGDSDPEPDADPEPDPEPDLDADPEPDPEPEPQRSRRDSRIERVLAERETERAARVRAEAEAQTLREERQRHETERTRQAALARENDPTVPYEQRIYEYTQRRDKELRDEMAATRSQLFDSSDRSEFASKAASNPVYARYQDRVETRLQEMRRAGNNAPREAILKFLVGEDALAPKAQKAASKQKDEAAARVKAARGSPTNARGDAGKGSGGKSKLGDLEKRLDGVQL